ncbi:hypothetical protein GWI33_003995, partial [Rhynchophorus ferrugineus]
SSSIRRQPEETAREASSCKIDRARPTRTRPRPSDKDDGEKKNGKKYRGSDLVPDRADDSEFGRERVGGEGRRWATCC